MNCAECLLEHARISGLDSDGRCPECGTTYSPDYMIHRAQAMRQTEYRTSPERFVHGRCRPCGVVFAWKAGRGRRLKDRPSCPECGRFLRQTAARLTTDPTQVRDPLWGSTTRSPRGRHPGARTTG